MLPRQTERRTGCASEIIPHFADVATTIQGPVSGKSLLSVTIGYGASTRAEEAAANRIGCDAEVLHQPPADIIGLRSGLRGDCDPLALLRRGSHGLHEKVCLPRARRSLDDRETSAFTDVIKQLAASLRYVFLDLLMDALTSSPSCDLGEVFRDVIREIRIGSLGRRVSKPLPRTVRLQIAALFRREIPSIGGSTNSTRRPTSR